MSDQNEARRGDGGPRALGGATNQIRKAVFDIVQALVPVCNRADVLVPAALAATLAVGAIARGWRS